MVTLFVGTLPDGLLNCVECLLQLSAEVFHSYNTQVSDGGGEKTPADWEGEELVKFVECISRGEKKQQNIFVEDMYTPRLIKCVHNPVVCYIPLAVTVLAESLH